MDLAAAIEKQTRRNRVRRGRREDGVLVGIGDADPETNYACPVCGDALRQKRSSRDKPFFCHIGGDGTCADDAVRHAAAVRMLGELVDHAVTGLLVMGFTVRCHAGRHEVDQRLDVAPGDAVRRDEHGVAVLRAGAVVFSLVVKRPHGEEDGHGTDPMTFAVDADEVLGWDADEALEDCQAGRQGTLVLDARAMTTDVPCGGCAKEREAAQTKVDKAAAAANAERVERCRAFADAIQNSRGLFETDFCPNHPDTRRVIDITDRHDDIVVDHTQDGERWDVALTKARKLVLGILIVKPDAMINESTPDHRCRNPGKTLFVAVPEDAEVDADSDAWPTNAWHLLSPGRCPRCHEIPRLTAKIAEKETAVAAGFQPGRRAMRPEQIRAEFIGGLHADGLWFPRAIKSDMEAVIRAAVERLLVAAAQVWTPERVEARRAQVTKDLAASVDRIAAAYARKHLVAGQPPKSAAAIHQSIRWQIGRLLRVDQDDLADVEPHIKTVIDGLVRQAWALWPGHEAKAGARRKRRQAEEAMGLRRWGRRRSGW